MERPRGDADGERVMPGCGLLAFCLRFWQSEEGSPALELGIVTPLFMILFAGVVGYGVVAYELMQVKTAAQAGALWALTNGFNAANIQTAVTSATGLPNITAPVPTQMSCGCANGTALVAATCGTTCTDGTNAGTYVTVNARYTVSPAVPGIGSTLNASITVRVQ